MKPPRITIPWIALVPDMSGVCSVFGTFEITSKPTKHASTKMVSSVSRSMVSRWRGAAAAGGKANKPALGTAGRMSNRAGSARSDSPGRDGKPSRGAQARGPRREMARLPSTGSPRCQPHRRAFAPSAAFAAIAALAVAAARRRRDALRRAVATDTASACAPTLRGRPRDRAARRRATTVVLAAGTYTVSAAVAATNVHVHRGGSRPTAPVIVGRRRHARVGARGRRRSTRPTPTCGSSRPGLRRRSRPGRTARSRVTAIVHAVTGDARRSS